MIVNYNNEKIKLPFKLKATECEELTTEEVKVNYTNKVDWLTLPRFANGVYLACLNAEVIGNKIKYEKGKNWLLKYFPFTAQMLFAK